MLTANRKPGDEITIGPNIVVKVLKIKDGKVVLGIDAPHEVEIAWPGKQRVEHEPVQLVK